MTDSIARLRAAGVSVWLDDLSRERLRSGSLAALRDRGVSGVTTNPTIFARAISDSDAYAGQIRDLKLRQVPADQALRELTASDVRQACDVLRPVYEATSGVDGRVSIEVDPRIAHDTGRTVAEARALWWLAGRPNLFIKIPAARQGLPAITACLAEGISINVTLIFSLARYAEVIEAFLAGLEAARAAGRDLSGIASVASFSCPAWTPRSTGGWTRSARRKPPRCAARPPSPTPGSPTSVTSRPSRPDGGGRWSGPEPGRSARCGPPPASRTPPTTTPGTSPAWSPPA